MKVIKRDGREVDFDRNKIISAIGKANSESLQNHEKHCLMMKLKILLQEFMISSDEVSEFIQLKIYRI